MQLFAPFSVGLSNKKIEINKNTASAADCAVSGVAFSPAGGTTDQTTVSLPSSIIATINTTNCIDKTIEFSIDESFNYLDQQVFTKKITVAGNQTQLKLFPTEFRCGSKNLCGFKYNVGYGAYSTQYGWSMNFKSANSDDYLYKCNTTGCTNQSSWTGDVTTGGNGSTEKPDITYSIKMTGKVTNSDKKATVTLAVEDKTDYIAGISGSKTYKYTVNIYLKDSNGTVVQEKKLSYDNWLKVIDPIEFTTTPSTKYTIDGSIDVFETTLLNGQSSGKTYNDISRFDTPLSFTSNKEGDQTVTETGNISAVSVNDTNGVLPACALFGSNGTPLGCLAQGLYYLLFRTTSFIFGLTGKAMDFTLMYSINDNSYRSTFVLEGWGVVRDFCNMFFIFVLLYVAFGTILNLHSVKTKEMIINVVLIGLLMNFSLFATQVIIDASNILARVFYNQSTIVTGSQKDVNGNTISELGDFGEIKLSEAIVSKVDPQKLIIEAQKVEAIPIKGAVEGEDTTTTSQGITTGSFILVTLLATAVNVFGLMAFLSLTVLFISRVVGLWIAMILVPLAFFSYTVPALSSMKTVGWQHWWPDTLKLAFLAPIFMFFMYIIIGFTNKGLGLLDASSKTGLSFVVAVAVPFVFIIVLLNKAKDIAKDMSGEIGQSITGAINTVGGLALGGAALGGAAIGRKVIGQSLASASRSKGAKERLNFSNKVDDWKAQGSIGPEPTWKQHARSAGVARWNPIAKLGAKLNEKQKEVGNIDHARHVMDETKKAAGLEGIDDKKLSGQDISKLQATFARTKQSENETQVKNGYNAKGEEIKLLDPSTGNLMTNSAGEEMVGAEDFKKKMRHDVEEEYRTTNGIAAGTILTSQQSKDIENELSNKLNASVKATVKVKVEKDFNHERTEAVTHVNPITRGFAGANKASYDVRKISDMKTDKREGLFTKSSVALIAAVATGVRGGIRGMGAGNGGIKVQGDFMKDLGNTITDSLKSMKINVNVGGGDSHKSSADAHGGDAHGGGHH